MPKDLYRRVRRAARSKTLLTPVEILRLVKSGSEASRRKAEDPEFARAVRVEWARQAVGK